MHKYTKILILISICCLCFVAGSRSTKMSSLFNGRAEISKPSRSVLEIVDIMRTQKGLSDRTLTKEVKWYLVQNDTDFETQIGVDEPGFICTPLRKQLVNQLLDNVKSEVVVYLPEVTGKEGLGLLINGQSYELLVNESDSYKYIQECLNERLYTLCEEWTPEYAYLLLTLHDVPKQHTKRHVRYNDIRMYLTAYAVFNSYPSITNMIEEYIKSYPSGWIDQGAIEVVLEMTVNYGVNGAYAHYQDCYIKNSYVHKYSTPNIGKQGDRFDITNAFSGWPGDWIMGVLTVENKNAEPGKMRLFGVEECSEVVLNGEDIFHQTYLENNNLYFQVPPGSNEYRYRIKVLNDWWDFQTGKN